jgi:hypothetical protein
MTSRCYAHYPVIIIIIIIIITTITSTTTMIMIITTRLSSLPRVSASQPSTRLTADNVVAVEDGAALPHPCARAVGDLRLHQLRAPGRVVHGRQPAACARTHQQGEACDHPRRLDIDIALIAVVVVTTVP